MRTTTIAAAVLAAALGLAGCGSATDTGSGASSSAGAAKSSAAASVKSGDTVDGAALAKRMTDAMVAAGSGSMAMDFGGQGKADGSFVMKGSSMEQQMTMELQGEKLEVVSVGGVIYMKGLPGSEKPWVKIDPKADDPVSKMFAGLAGQDNDPRQFAKALQGTKATVVGTSGDTTEYEVTIDPSKLLGGTGGSTAAPSVAPVTAHYTLDKQDRPTVMTTEVQGQTLKITFSDWGTKTTITAPPADQVGTFKLPTG
jgi:hypothetical protein